MLFRAGWPGLVGLVFLLFGMQSLASGLQSGDAGELADHLRTSAIPNAIGIVLLLAARAIRRRTRLGHLLGIAVGALGVLAGLGLIVLEIPFLQEGGESAAFGGGFVVVAAVWSLLWLLYTWRLWKARSSFAPAWVPADRRLALVIAAIVVIGAGVYVGIGALQANAAANGAIDEARAQELVNGTSIEVRVIDVTTEPGSATTGGPTAVARLTLDVTVHGVEAYQLVVAPGLCLTDLATYEDPAFKPDVYCWGTPSPATVLGTAFSDLSIPVAERTIRLVLERGASRCAFAPGVWSAALSLAPQLGDTDGAIGPAPSIYTRAATFRVEEGSAPPPSGTVPRGSACLASLVSP
jgi:hypothetical protein